MNAQSAAIENVLTRSGIPYRVIGGHRFFDRKEMDKRNSPPGISFAQ